MPKPAGIDEPFYPQALERGRRSSRAVMLAIAEMYMQSVSTRVGAKVIAEFGLKSLSPTQVSRASALLDEELSAWRSQLAITVLVEIDEDWATSNRVYINWDKPGA